MELTSEKPWKYLTSEIQWIKEDSVSHINIKIWADNMEYYISPIFSNLFRRLKGMEGVPKEGFTHHSEDKIQDLEEIFLEEIKEVADNTEGTYVFMGGRWFQIMYDYITFLEEYIPDGQFQWFIYIVSY